MKINIAKNYVSKIVAAMFYLIMSTYGQCGYAVTLDIPIELQCSENPLGASWFIIPGQSETQYTLTTKGIRENMRENVEEVTKPLYVSKIHDEVSVCVEARCIPSNKASDISLTNSFFVCGIGEGIKIKMFEPNSSNPDQYHYVGVLTATKNEKTTIDVKSKGLSQTKLWEKGLDHFPLLKPISFNLDKSSY